MTVGRGFIARLLFALVSGTTGLSAAHIRCYLLKPPLDVLPGVRRLVVMDFAGTGGERVSQYLVGSLTDSRRGMSSSADDITYLSGARTNMFSVIDKNELARVLNEHFASGDDTAAVLSNVTGIDAIVSGSITAESLDQSDQRQQVSWVDSAQNNLVDCVTRRVSLTIRMQVTSARTREILATVEGTTATGDDKCGADRATLESVEDLADQCEKEIVARDLIDHLAPRFVEREFTLREVRNNENREVEERGNEACDAAEGGQLDRAFRLFSQILLSDHFNDAVYYDIGVLNEVVGNFTEADSCYRIASGLREDEDYAKALENCRITGQDIITLDSLGIPIRNHIFSESNPATRVHLKGDKDERIPIRASASDTSAIIARVPGGSQVDLIGTEGNWIKVKMFDGEMGYVRNLDLDQ